MMMTKSVKYRIEYGDGMGAPRSLEDSIVYLLSRYVESGMYSNSSYSYLDCLFVPYDPNE
jgi:hypothetical protein